ncbi:hypothetical protein [Thiolinea disciformis]|uniref:hypothetical protein n=1 Tax=Thiolinea disciformis TaxID=125614 RepID=UPI0003653CCF|nr:hypothetical protein [Thiolinea disciformis]
MSALRQQVLQELVSLDTPSLLALQNLLVTLKRQRVQMLKRGAGAAKSRTTWQNKGSESIAKLIIDDREERL